MDLVLRLERDEDGMFVAECPAIPGCLSHGETREEAMRNIREAVFLCLETRRQEGLALTVETEN